MIHDAVLSEDPGLLKALMLPIDKPWAKGTQSVGILGKTMNLWLAGSGKRILEDIQNETDNFEENSNE